MKQARILLLPVPAGFPSPADDFRDKPLDLDDLLIVHPAATYFARVSGDSMHNLGIREHDIVVVDRALEAQQNSIVLVSLNGGFTVKRLHFHNDITYLLSAHPMYKPMKITKEMDFSVWGVITACILFLCDEPKAVCTGRLQQFLCVMRAGLSHRTSGKTRDCDVK